MRHHVISRLNLLLMQTALCLLMCIVVTMPVAAASPVTGMVCGGPDQTPCSKHRKATLTGRAKELGCKGKDVYWSLLKGGCWVCPKDFTRTLFPLTGKKACKGRDQDGGKLYQVAMPKHSGV